MQQASWWRHYGYNQSGFDWQKPCVFSFARPGPFSTKNSHDLVKKFQLSRMACRSCGWTFMQVWISIVFITSAESQDNSVNYHVLHHVNVWSDRVLFPKLYLKNVRDTTGATFWSKGSKISWVKTAWDRNCTHRRTRAYHIQANVDLPAL